MGLLDALPKFARLNKLVRANILSPSGKMAELLEEIRKEPTKENIASVKDANLVTSEVSPGRHIPVLDIDMASVVIESSTPGHGHLYIDKEMPWSTYVKLMEAMQEAGILQAGFVAGAKERGYSSVRLPHINKENIEDNVIDPVAFKKKQEEHKGDKKLGKIGASIDQIAGTDKWTAAEVKQILGKLLAATLSDDNPFKPSLQSEFEKIDTPS